MASFLQIQNPFRYNYALSLTKLKQVKVDYLKIIKSHQALRDKYVSE